MMIDVALLEVSVVCRMVDSISLNSGCADISSALWLGLVGWTYTENINSCLSVVHNWIAVTSG
jgi:hypothetical protein